MKILITGGTGFIGSALCDLLRGHAHDLIVLTRGRKRQKQRTQFLNWNGKEVPKNADGCEAVINLAGQDISVRWTKANRRAILESRVLATEACREYVKRNQSVRTFLSGSAVGFYGTDPEKVFEETDAPGNDFLAEVCNSWENAAEGTHARTVFLRTSLVLGKKGGLMKRLHQLYRMWMGAMPGKGNQPFPWIHLEDETGIINHALKTTSLEGPLNLCAPEEVRYRDFHRAMSDLTGGPSFLQIPAPLIRLGMGEQALLLLEGQYVSARKVMDSGYQFRFDKLRDALRNVAANGESIA